MKHILHVEIDTDNAHKANIIREEIVGAIENFAESWRPGFSVLVSDLEAIETERHEALIGLARERYAYGSSDNIEVDGNARLSDAQEEGCWVQGWLWLSGDMLRERGLLPDDEDEPEPAETVDSEGGHCD